MKGNHMIDGHFIVDATGKSYGNFFIVKDMLYDKKSDYQQITVFDTEEVGRILMLDYAFNVSTLMEAFYHEPMAHVPLAMCDGNIKVCIIGGGDFGVAMHVLKHGTVSECLMCELDPAVIEVSRTYFSQWSACEKDSRFSLFIDDGSQFIETVDNLDVIIIDSTDPSIHAKELISESFYKKCYRALKKDGVVMQIIADTIFYKDVWAGVIPTVSSLFPSWAPVLVPVPFYVTGCWGLLFLSKSHNKPDLSKIDSAYLSRIPGLKTMTPDIVRGWFSLPPYMNDYVEMLT
jgi:spermidine synthase